MNNLPEAIDNNHVNHCTCIFVYYHKATKGRRGWSIPMKHNITLEVYQGDITLESVDVIVNSTNKDFDLTKGKSLSF